MKTQSMSLREFMNGPVKEENKIIVHFKKHGETYIKVAGLTAVALVGFDMTAFASSGIDVGARQLYIKLIGVGKWIIIFKGGFDIIKSMTSGHKEEAKSHFLGYLLTYLLLLGFPFLMDEVDTVFQGLTK